jgi:hypothetical protein
VTLDPLTLNDAISGLSARAVTVPVAFVTLTVAGAAGTPIVTLFGDTERGCPGVVAGAADEPPHAEHVPMNRIATSLAIVTVCIS